MSSELRTNIDAKGGVFNISVEDLGAVIDMGYPLPLKKMIFLTGFSGAEKAMFALKLAKLGESDLCDQLFDSPSELLACIRPMDRTNQQTAIDLLWIH